VLIIQGDIVDGNSALIPLLDTRLVGARTLLPVIENARADGRVKAIVVRVNSPGGSALASDLIARELERTALVKPVVCSFGDLAASGGYYVAAPCQRIFAAPSTLTGSIGIFSGKFDVSGLATKLGVSVDVEKRGARADIESMWREYTDEERRILTDKLRYFYNRFVETVARGRHLSGAQVDAVGRGHVWSGEAGLARGLVDELGGVMDAVAEAKRRAGLRQDDPVELAPMPTETTLLGELAGLLGIGARVRSQVAETLALVPGLKELLAALPASLLAEPSVPQARLEDGLLLQ
jgi:protease-4